ncbi:MAG TPA: glycosyltransferase [Candidatus Saccharimonadales bacterium]|nr:glycosyltransferase [Candidatus Saccharimonadales bacterium]
MTLSHAMYYLIAFLSLLNFVRVLVMLIGADIYDIRQLRRRQSGRAKRAYRPLITVVIPAYNEETGVIRTLESVMANTYTNKQIIVVDDGSKDKTLAIVRQYQRRFPGQFTVVHQQNAGKAAAINRAVSKWAKGSLIMVVDADSLLKPDAIASMVAHFRDRRVIASAANVKIIPTTKLLGIAQRFEYLISYRMKRALTTANMEYIVGGVGSTFRKSVLLKTGLYDTDTMTEDIDLTVKLIREYGNKAYKINYAADTVAYTEHVLTFKQLVRQRFRWKYGRMQTLLKNPELFFSRSQKYDKRLTWYQLPYAIVGEIVLLLEPLLVGYIMFVLLVFADTTSLLSVYIIVTSFVFLMLLGEDTETTKTKLTLAAALPATYILMYILTAVEFAALAQSIVKGRQLFRREVQHASWEHVDRSGQPVSLQ